MTWPRWAPSARSSGLAAVLVPAALVIVGVVAWFTDTDTARTAYLGMVFMAVGVLTLSRSQQLLLAAVGGLAAGLGALVAQHTVLLVGTVALACLAQWPFNRRSTQVAALLPYLVVLYAVTAPPEPLRVVGATWLGALALMGLGVVDGSSTTTGTTSC